MKNTAWSWDRSVSLARVEQLGRSSPGKNTPLAEPKTIQNGATTPDQGWMFLWIALGDRVQSRRPGVSENWGDLPRTSKNATGCSPKHTILFWLLSFGEVLNRPTRVRVVHQSSPCTECCAQSSRSEWEAPVCVCVWYKEDTLDVLLIYLRII